MAANEKMSSTFGEFQVRKNNTSIHISSAVETIVKNVAGVDPTKKQKPAYKLAIWFEQLEKIHLNRSTDPKVK